MSAEEASGLERKSLRIAQINILNNKEGEEYRYNFLAHSLKNIGADIVTIQEARNHELLQKILGEAGYVHSAFADKRNSDLPHSDGVAVFSREKHPIISEQQVKFPFKETELINGMIAEFQINDAPFYVYSGHFAWNMLNESVRLFQAQKVSGLAKELTDSYKKAYKDDNAVFIMGTDMNTSDKSRTYRYLAGLDPVVTMDSKGKVMLNSAARADDTFFIDAYEFSGRDMLSSTSSDSFDAGDNWATTDQGNSYWGRKTAERHGSSDPRFLPKRRIDYILSYGWRYGRRGCPVNYHRFGNAEPENGFDYELSDHYGIYSDILL